MTRFTLLLEYICLYQNVSVMPTASGAHLIKLPATCAYAVQKNVHWNVASAAVSVYSDVSLHDQSSLLDPLEHKVGINLSDHHRTICEREAPQKA